LKVTRRLPPHVRDYALIALGTVHALGTRVFYDGLSPGAIWFAGTGLSLVFLGILNLVATAAASSRAWLLCRIANLIGAAFGLLAVLAVPEPQAYLGLLLLVMLVVTSFRSSAAPVPG
jgi:hypothetical protein